ncbi:type I-E CRISPR-associated protein Cse1/CasA [Glycomyces dulcitolivorans]|uniref:type I-E CRISPR-associated protein Cse1/CasA n=1 Tax=Glycomyces dulcitolivorans TaxID=2200759 RepID=UPI000DD4B4E4|nr:type I-E CRISPR-associated protein Cse1/CasA [Glycomyces dulcitolivorans]
MGSDDFDLVTREWIEVSWVGADPDLPRQVGLRTLFTRASEISDFHAPLAPASAGLMRVLAVLTARITGLDAIDGKRAWQRRRLELLDAGRFDPEAVGQVLGAGGFTLFGERPFLQDPRLREECKSFSGIGKFAWTRVAGANQVFLSHDLDSAPVPVPAAEAVWHLLAWMYYGPSGRCTSRKVGTVDKADTGAGPLRRTLSVHPWGPNLFETLLLNQTYCPPDPARPGSALWEAPLHDPLGSPPEGAGIGWRLANRFRHGMLLIPDEAGERVVDACATWAWRSAHPAVDDPYVPYQVNAKTADRYPRYASADRAIWRDLDALVLHVPAEAPVTHPQVIVDLKARPALRAEVMGRLKIRAFGYDQDGQTRDKAFFTTKTPPVLTALEDPVLEVRIEQAHHGADEVGRHLERTLNAAWHDLAGKPKKAPSWTGPAMAGYWAAAGRAFWDMAFTTAPLPVLPNAFTRIALGAFDTATRTYAVDPRTINLLETHRSRLFRGWRKEPLPDDNPGPDTAAAAPATSPTGGAGPDPRLQNTHW